ncbi:unnamed protein product [Blepharisma stoltei]|uniref:SWIM-type domain-containing protein n=1 Tax=Blepharisma stoltei TaxID=1481888 RepID=A0AAU9JRX6_9CILI|nr:unnamed protein product [Blepharisma stoltei]
MHDIFNCAIVIITINSYGANQLLAISLCRNEAEADYAWAFQQFKNQGFYSPETIVVDRNKAQFNALSKSFKKANIVFCLWHIIRNIQSWLSAAEIQWDKFAAYFYDLYEAKTLQEFKQRKIALLNTFPLLSNSQPFSNLCKQSKNWARYYTNAIFTIDIKTTSRSESMNASLKRICKRIKRNFDVKILMAFDEILEKETYHLEYRTKKHYGKKNCSSKSSYASFFSQFYTDFCIAHIESSINKLEYCKIIHLDKQKSIIEEQNEFSSNQYDLNIKKIICSCNKYIRYKIPCAHIIYINNVTGTEWINCIVNLTSRRWLLDDYLHVSNREIIKQLRSSITVKRKHSEDEEGTIRIRY